MARNTDKAPQPEDKTTEKPPVDIKCSFCGKNASYTRRLIAAPNNIFICDECVHICMHILKEEEEESTPPEPNHSPVPSPEKRKKKGKSKGEL